MMGIFKSREDTQMDINDTIFQFRLEATRDAQKMSRAAFLVSTIVSLAIIITTWNAYYSWYTDFPLKEKWPQSEVTKEVQRQIIIQWVESQTISVPILGIKIGVSDGSVFGSVALLIITIWFFLSIRRENHVIGFLLQDTIQYIESETRNKSETRKWIYHGIASYMVFSNITGKSEPIRVLSEKIENHQPDSMMRWAFKALVFLPPLSIIFLIFSDILTIYILPAFYRFPHTSLIEHLELGDAIKLSFMEAFAFILLILIIILCYKILAYVKCTAAILREYIKEHKPDTQNK